MSISFDDRTQRLIDKKLESGRYATADDVLLAALAALEQQESSGDFESGELDALLAEGERGIEGPGTVNAAQVFRGLRQGNAPGGEQPR